MSGALDAARRSAGRATQEGPVTFASPAVDLAQLLGHFGGWQAVGAVLTSYAAAAPLGEGDVATLAPEAVADLAA
ncbi:hypothetical protein [Rubrobacter radiotolerans]|uniref:Uncharacterized protein n=1 Tax=Rubrobacter radiotolerans TaxID=42256 RepID=A0AB35TB49_RUBRA|nr:hypothetical protein [Rubrobacter radiotolerans]MDX5895628.1 hypothetical protein [Rubrobacter radiotolerans]SMC01407.1 hypothetical protein SAMN00767673_3225 [Rubrobacter radiotolerans DSM 5868]